MDAMFIVDETEIEETPDEKNELVIRQDTTVQNFDQENEGTTRGRCKNCNEKYLTPGLIGIIIFVLAVIGIGVGLHVSSNSSSDTPSTPDNPKSPGKLVGQESSDVKCIHHTPKQFLDTLKDNIEEYCVPYYSPTGVKNEYTEQCLFPPKTYIKKMCLCDNQNQCNVTGTGPQSSDTVRKTGCFKCITNGYCPCQNNGSCEPCDTQSRYDIRCGCRDGTSGKFCTKITKRLCYPISKLDAVKDFHDCKRSNNQSCLSREYSSDLVCELTEDYKDFSNCSKDDTGSTEKHIAKENKQNQEGHTEDNMPNTVLFGLIAIASLILICLMIVRKFGKKC